MPSRSTIAAQNTQNPFIWDACCLLNLAATRREATILSTLGQSTNQSSWVVREVLEGETLTIRPYPKDPQQIPTPVDLSPLIQANVLSVIDLDIDEEKLFITIAQTLDDGESRTLAVAVHRGFSVLTDDRPTLRLIQMQYPQVNAYTTPDWVKLWVDQANPPDTQVREVIERIQVSSRYVPRSMHPLIGWWQSYLP